MPAQWKRPSERRGVDTPFQSNPRNARRRRVRRSRDTLPPRNETVRHRPNRTLSRNETIRPRNRAWSRTLQQRLLNRLAQGDRPTPPTLPLPTTHHPEHTAERGNHNSQTGTEQNDARVDDAPLHNEAHRAAAGATTVRKPMLGAYTARVVERTRKWDAIA